MLIRVYGIADPAATADPTYAENLRATVSVAIEHGIAGIELADSTGLHVPVALLAQARIAARNGVTLDTVLRRYFAGYALLGDFFIEEAERAGLSGDALKRSLRAQGALFDRLLAAVGEEHARERENRVAGSEQRRAERVKRLLDGELIDVSKLSYNLDSCHLAMAFAGVDKEIEEVLREVALSLDRSLLSIRHDPESVWVWLGGRRALDPGRLLALISERLPAGASVAVGEPGGGLEGWRLSHRQAQAALPVALRGRNAAIRYADVALLASILQDDLLTTSLHRLFLAPLEEGRDGGETAHRTLRAYFAADRNISSAAAALGVKRHTVTNRLREIEARIGRALSGCQAELQVALRLDEVAHDARRRQRGR